MNTLKLILFSIILICVFNACTNEEYLNQNELQNSNVEVVFLSENSHLQGLVAQI